MFEIFHIEKFKKTKLKINIELLQKTEKWAKANGLKMNVIPPARPNCC